MIDRQVLAEAVTHASSSELSNPLPIVLMGLVAIAFGLPMLLKPRWVARPPKWQFKNAEQVKPSEFSIDLIRISGVLFVGGGIAFIVIALVV